MRFLNASRNWAIALAALCLLAACSGGSGQQGFTIKRASLVPRFKELNVRINSDLALSREAREALQNGVPLTLNLSMELRDSHNLTLLATEALNYEIRYLPLSQHYQLAQLEGDLKVTYPRLRHALGELSSINRQFETGPLAPGDYEFRARIRLVQSALPGPMQLPALLSDNWRHDTGWTQWPLKVSA